MYADYEFYTGTYIGGALTEEEFARAATRASSFLDYFTRNKAKDYTGDELKLCCCALAEQYQIIENAQTQSMSGGELQSQSVGSWSKSYRSGTETAAAAREALAGIATRHLAHTGLLYRGGGRCVSSHCHDI